MSACLARTGAPRGVGFGMSRESPTEAAFIRNRPSDSTSLRWGDCLRIIEAATVPIRLAATNQANSLACKSLERAFLVQWHINKAAVTTPVKQVVPDVGRKENVSIPSRKLFELGKELKFLSRPG